jgi:hypothetical protein
MRLFLAVAFLVGGYALGWGTCVLYVQHLAHEAAADGATHALLMPSGTVCLEIVSTPTGAGIRVIKCR